MRLNKLHEHGQCAMCVCIGVCVLVCAYIAQTDASLVTPQWTHFGNLAILGIQK